MENELICSKFENVQNDFNYFLKLLSLIGPGIPSSQQTLHDLKEMLPVLAIQICKFAKYDLLENY
jgi:hypothetical protein